jgi:hypothetical protein
MKKAILTYGFIFFLATLQVFAQNTLLVPQLNNYGLEIHRLEKEK